MLPDLPRHPNAAAFSAPFETPRLWFLLWGGEALAPRPAAARGSAVAGPILLTLPMPEEQEDAFLTLRWRETMEIVTVIELLSPGNKRASPDGRREYLAKREEILRSATHRIELDLLRGGERLPTKEPLPPGDEDAFVARGNQRPRVAVYSWSLRDPLPRIPVPLPDDDPDATLDLQAALPTVYDRAGYELSLKEDVPLRPPLSEADADGCGSNWQPPRRLPAPAKGRAGAEDSHRSDTLVPGPLPTLHPTPYGSGTR